MNNVGAGAPIKRKHTPILILEKQPPAIIKTAPDISHIGDAVAVVRLLERGPERHRAI